MIVIILEIFLFQIVVHTSTQPVLFSLVAIDTLTMLTVKGHCYLVYAPIERSQVKANNPSHRRVHFGEWYRTGPSWVAQ